MVAAKAKPTVIIGPQERVVRLSDRGAAKLAALFFLKVGAEQAAQVAANLAGSFKQRYEEAVNSEFDIRGITVEDRDVDHNTDNGTLTLKPASGGPTA